MCILNVLYFNVVMFMSEVLWLNFYCLLFFHSLCQENCRHQDPSCDFVYKCKPYWKIIKACVCSRTRVMRGLREKGGNARRSFYDFFKIRNLVVPSSSSRAHNNKGKKIWFSTCFVQTYHLKKSNLYTHITMLNIPHRHLSDSMELEVCSHLRI